MHATVLRVILTPPFTWLKEVSRVDPHSCGGKALASSSTRFSNASRDSSCCSQMRLRWHFQTECPRGPEIDDQLEFRGLYDRQVGGLFTLENATRACVMHRSAITPEPPNRAAAADTHILNSNQTVK